MTYEEALKVINSNAPNDEKAAAIAKLGVDLLAAKTALGVADGFSPDVFVNQIKSQSAIKADLRFTVTENIVQTFGEAEDGIDGVASRLTNLQNEIYDTNFLHSAKLDGLEMTRFFEDEQAIYSQFLGIIDKNNSLMTHFTKGVTAKSASDTVLLGNALGYSSDQMQSFLVRQHAMTGKVDTELLKRTLAFSTAIHRKTGLSSKIVAENIAVMMKDVSTFGSMTDTEMARASAAITKMGVSMTTVSSLMNNFNSFEDAAGNVSKLTQALGVNLNVSDIVDLANSGVDGSATELIMMLQDSFDDKNIDITKQDLPLKRVVARIVSGGDVNEMEKMFGAARAGLLDFMDTADSAIEGTNQSDFDSALVDAKNNIKQWQIAKGDMDASYKAGLAKLSSSLSTALSGTTLELKKSLDDAVHKSNSILSKSVSGEGGLLKGLVEAVEIEMKALTDSVMNGLTALERAIANKDWGAVQKALGWLTEEEKKEKEDRDERIQRTRGIMADLLPQAETRIAGRNGLTKLTANDKRTVTTDTGNLTSIGKPATVRLQSVEEVIALGRILQSTDSNLVEGGIQKGDDVSLKNILKQLTSAIKAGREPTMKIFYDENGKFNITKDGKKVAWVVAN